MDETNPMAGFGDRLREARAAAGLTQQEVADFIGAAREMISYWENGRRVPSLVQVARLADAYGVSERWLFGREAARPVEAAREPIERALAGQPAKARAGVNRWLGFLDSWAAIVEEASGAPLPGPAGERVRGWSPPKRRLDPRDAPRLAAEVREHFGLGTGALPDLGAFLGLHGVLVHRFPLGPLTTGQGVAGAWVDHPRLGPAVLVNSELTPGRQLFGLAHEFAHVLFDDREPSGLCLVDDRSESERFADVFAAHFLVPAASLRAALVALPEGRLREAAEVLAVQRLFRVGYATLLLRLREEELVTAAEFAQWRSLNPARLADAFGWEQGDERLQERRWLSLASHPANVLSGVARLVREDWFSPAAAAEYLGVSLPVVLQSLLPEPRLEPDARQREFDELEAGPATQLWQTTAA